MKRNICYQTHFFVIFAENYGYGGTETNQALCKMRRPGSAKTDLARESLKETWFRVLMFLWTPMLWSLEKAATTNIYLATSPEVEGKTGGFYGKCRELKVKQKLISAESQRKIWDYCERATAEWA